MILEVGDNERISSMVEVESSESSERSRELLLNNLIADKSLLSSFLQGLFFLPGSFFPLMRGKTSGLQSFSFIGLLHFNACTPPYLTDFHCYL